MLYTFINFGVLLSISLFANAYGTSSEEYGGFSIVQSPDGGFVSVGGRLDPSFADEALAFKVNSTGQLVWQRTYGPLMDSDEDVYSVDLTGDGGYVMAGMYGPPASADALVMKINSTGGLVWAKTFGGTSDDAAQCIIRTPDGGYAVVAFGMGASSADILFLKLNSTGGLTWGKRFGGPNWDYPNQVIRTSDGGYAIAGYTNIGVGNDDFLVLKTNSTGGLVWGRTFIGSSIDEASSIVETPDNGYIAVGGSWSFGAGSYDFLVIRLNSSGDLVWARTIGGSGSDWPNSIIPAIDGGYVIAGSTTSYGTGGYDCFVVKIAEDGSVVWAYTFGTNGSDIAHDIIQTTDGGYAITGYTYGLGAGGSDVLIIKFNADGTYPSCAIPCSPEITAVSLSSSSITWDASYSPFLADQPLNENNPTFSRASLCPPVSAEEGFPEHGIHYVRCVPFAGGLKFFSGEELELTLYRPDGRLVYAGTISKGENRIGLEQGVYFWRAGDFSGVSVVR
ncbi:MAG: hypothetical protein ABIM88_02905 [candidate division WOR-3 bacterium]